MGPIRLAAEFERQMDKYARPKQFPSVRQDFKDLLTYTIMPHYWASRTGRSRSSGEVTAVRRFACGMEACKIRMRVTSNRLSLRDGMRLVYMKHPHPAAPCKPDSADMLVFIKIYRHSDIHAAGTETQLIEGLAADYHARECASEACRQS